MALVGLEMDTNMANTDIFLSFTHLPTVVEPLAFLEEALSFRYPPYSLENIAKMAVEDTQRIKPGETMEDQEIPVPNLENGAS